MMLEILIKTTEFFLLLVILLDCNSVYRAAIDLPIDAKEWGMTFSIGAAAVLIVLYLIKDRRNFQCIKDHATMFFLSFVFCMEFNALNSINVIQSDLRVTSSSPFGYGKYFTGYFLIFMNLMVILYRIYRKNGESFRLLYLLEKMVLFLAVISLAMWIGASLLKLWGQSNDVYVFWGGQHYYSNYLNLYVVRWWYHGDLTKNLGIFLEPPMYGLFLGFSLYVELFLKKKSNPSIVMILVAALISCRAILALLICMGAFLLLFLEWIHAKKCAKLVIPLVLIATALGGVLLVIYKMHVGWGSFATHIDDFVASFKCWLEYPILGCGYDYPYPIFNYISDFRAENLGLSNSAGVVLAEGGIILFCYYVIPFAVMMAGFFRGNRKLAYWSLGMFLFWVVVIFHARVFIFFLMALGYSAIDLKFHLKPTESEEKTSKSKATGELGRHMEFSVWNFDENLSEDGRFFGKMKLDLSSGFVTCMALAVAFIGFYGFFFVKNLSVPGRATCGILMAAEVGVLIWNLFQKRTKQENSWIQIEAWLILVFFGQPYQILSTFMKRTGMRIQDVWWLPIVTAVALYAFGTALTSCVFGGILRRTPRRQMTE